VLGGWLRRPLAGSRERPGPPALARLRWTVVADASARRRRRRIEPVVLVVATVGQPGRELVGRRCFSAIRTCNHLVLVTGSDN
jgi:hypothetical protein